MTIFTFIIAAIIGVVLGLYYEQFEDENNNI